MTLPTPTLRHCIIGQLIRMQGETKRRVLVHKCSKYAYFDLYQASLSCPVDPVQMVFGEGDGWRAA